MSIYRQAGAAVLSCESCKFRQRVEWKTGDPPIYSDEVDDHHMRCSGSMVQVTHNDGETPLNEPCPSYCCPPSSTSRKLHDDGNFDRQHHQTEPG